MGYGLTNYIVYFKGLGTILVLYNFMHVHQNPKPQLVSHPTTLKDVCDVLLGLGGDGGWKKDLKLDRFSLQLLRNVPI